ncbi:aspartate aminotransferase family protein [Candidatus Binatia bacterium]|nr:aspartate aminotransferase family protein [Candidatus Binatia bacterium]
MPERAPWRGTATDIAMDEVSRLRGDFVRHVCQTSPQPLGLVVSRASGCAIRDHEGRAYLDLLAGMGVANIGHAHPEVVAAIERQVRDYLHVAVYGEMVQRPQVELARRLAEVAPGTLDVVYFTNSGTEAIEGALKTARKFTGRSGLVAFEGSFHGDTCGALSIGGNRTYRVPFEPLLPGVKFLPFGEVDGLDRIDTAVAAVVVEPIQGEGGVRIPPPEFLPALRRRCDTVGAMLVIDEVITGFGRTGKLFAVEHWGVEPDLLVLAKALGGGMPLGAFVGRAATMATLQHDPPLAHVTTFGGHPVSCAAGLAAFEVLVRDDLPARAAQLGQAWLAVLRGMCGERLSSVRGLGLLLALEFSTPEVTRRFVAECLKRGLILNWTLHRDTVVRLAPPLTIGASEIEQATAAMREALAVL